MKIVSNHDGVLRVGRFNIMPGENNFEAADAKEFMHAHGAHPDIVSKQSEKATRGKNKGSPLLVFEGHEKYPVAKPKEAKVPGHNDGTLPPPDVQRLQAAADADSENDDEKNGEEKAAADKKAAAEKKAADKKAADEKKAAQR